MKKSIIIQLFLISLLVGGIISCSKDSGDDPIPEIKPIAKLEVTDYEDGDFLLDASTSTDADQIKWSVPGIIDNPTWESFYSVSTKTITVPDPTKDYTVTVTVKNEFGESSKSKTLTGKPVVVKYTDFQSLGEMLVNPYISDALTANNMETYSGSSPSNIDGLFGVVVKENHKVKINGSVQDFEEESYETGSYWENWRPFLTSFGNNIMTSTYYSGRTQRVVEYNIQGSGNDFTIYFQDELNPWYTKLSGDHFDPIEITEGVHIVSGQVLENGDLSIKSLWVRIWENESTDGTGNWSYSEFTLKLKEWKGEKFTDSRDGNEYRIKTYGDDTWMVQPLRYEPKEADGYSGYSHWGAGTDNSGSDKLYGYTGEADIALELAGYAYTWAAATNGETGTQVRGVCPEGWHFATAEEYQRLIDFHGGNSVAGKKLKSELWWLVPAVGDNESGFDMGMFSSIIGTTTQHFTGGDRGYDNAFWIFQDDTAPKYAGVSWGDDAAYSVMPLPHGTDTNGLAVFCVKDKE